MATSCPFIMAPKDASELVHNCRMRNQDTLNGNGNTRNCYTLQVMLKPVYGDVKIPYGCFKTLPRLLNGIPLGAGHIEQELSLIRWRYIDGHIGSHSTFISLPMSSEDAREALCKFRDGLVVHSKKIFGDVVVKANVMMSQCHHFCEDLILNDVVISKSDCLYFRE